MRWRTSVPVVFHDARLARSISSGTARKAARALWKTDGTTAGTVVVKDLPTGSSLYGSIARNLTLAGGKLYFTTKDGSSTGDELRASQRHHGGDDGGPGFRLDRRAASITAPRSRT